METQEWVTKAERDWLSLNRDMSWPTDVNYDDVCYHAQQCAEKYLKARLTEAVVYFPKTHNLKELLDIALPLEPQWDVLRPVLIALNPYAVEFRYPGHTASCKEADEAVKLCAEVRAAIRPSLGLSV